MEDFLKFVYKNTALVDEMSMHTYIGDMPIHREMIGSRIRVLGKVQGVWFRKHTAEKAEQLGLSGWVRNEPDGSVLIHAEGAAEALEKFLHWCGTGPPSANVVEVDSSPTPPEGFDRFIIRR